MTGITLRPARSEDAEFTYQVRKAAFREYVEDLLGWDEQEERRRHAAGYRAQDFRVIQADGLEVGILRTELAEDRLHLHQLYLLPEHQGRGIGAACARIVMDEARRLRLPVHLTVIKNNARARAFWERLGFVRHGATATHDLFRSG